MRLPEADRAVIDAAKIRDYLLAPSHPVGRFKAAFFFGLGYSRDSWGRLEVDLRGLAISGDAVPGQAIEYGQKYEVRGTLKGPAGHMAQVVTVWIVATGDNIPRFVTAYPGK